MLSEHNISLWIFVLMFLAGLLFAPLVAFTIVLPLVLVDDVARVGYKDAALVFGAATEQGNPTPLLKERLDTALYLFEHDRIGTIVVSNTQPSVEVMKGYLVEHGVPEQMIEVDAHALVTQDTCLREFEVTQGGRSVVFISQRYHLPRIIELCRNAGVDGAAVAANRVAPDDGNEGRLERLIIRMYRLTREAALSWHVVIQKYAHTYSS